MYADSVTGSVFYDMNFMPVVGLTDQTICLHFAEKKAGEAVEEDDRR